MYPWKCSFVIGCFFCLQFLLVTSLCRKHWCSLLTQRSEVPCIYVCVVSNFLATFILVSFYNCCSARSKFACCRHILEMWLFPLTPTKTCPSTHKMSSVNTEVGTYTNYLLMCKSGCSCHSGFDLIVVL